MVNDALLVSISGHAAEIEAARRLPESISNEIRDAGLYRMFAPKQVGGGEVDPLTGLRAIETVATADASAAWCVMISSTSSLVLAMIPESHSAEMGVDADTVLAGVFAPRGRAEVQGDELIATGNWPWGSNTANADWILGGCVVVEDGEVRKLPNGVPDSRMLLFPKSDVTLHDTWHVMGLNGTGSTEYSVDGARLPYAQSVSLMSDRPWHDGPLYVFPVFGMLALGIAAVALGNARAAVDDLVAVATEKRPQASARRLAEQPHAIRALAESESTLRSARAFYYETVASVWDAAQRDGEIAVESRALMRLAATNATRTSAEVARAMHDLAGGTSVFSSHSLQRRFRDAHVMTQHMMCGPQTLDLAGRVLMGLETDATFL